MAPSQKTSTSQLTSAIVSTSPEVGHYLLPADVSSVLSSSTQSLHSSPRPSDTDLFTRLLLDREGLYGVNAFRSRSATPDFPTDQPSRHNTWPSWRRKRRKHTESIGRGHRSSPDSGQVDDRHILHHLNSARSMAIVTSSSRYQPKQFLTKRQAKEIDSVTRKRPAPTTIIAQPRSKAAKLGVKRNQEIDVQVPIGEIGDTVDPRKTPDVIVISDDEDEDTGSTFNVERSISMSPSQGSSEAKPIKLEPDEKSFHTAESLHGDGIFRSTSSPHISRETTLSTDGESDHQIERLRQELADAKAETERVRLSLEADIQNQALTLEIVREESEKQEKGLQQALEAERDKFREVTRERDDLRDETDTRNTLYEELREEHQSLLLEHERAKREHRETLADVLKQGDIKNGNHCAESQSQPQLTANSSSSNSSITQINQDEITFPSPISQSFSNICRITMSPAPSSSSGSTKEDIRVENLRKIYGKVKRRYDNLHAVAVGLNNCTRNMDSSSFGEFGKYIRQLKTALDEEMQERRATGVSGDVRKVE